MRGPAGGWRDSSVARPGHRPDRLTRSQRPALVWWGRSRLPRFRLHSTRRRRALATTARRLGPTMIPPSPYQARVFGDSIDAQERIVDALTATAEGLDPVGWADLRSQLHRIAHRLETCCQCPMIYALDDDDRIVFSEMRCRSRICARCGRSRRLQLISQLTTYLQCIDSPRLLTLTMQSTKAPLREQLLTLRRCFANLRRSRLWKDRVPGGLYTVEVTYNRKTGQWHPHIHAVIDGLFIPQAELADKWHEITGSSYIVDIRRCNSRRKAIEYLAEYVGKSSDVHRFPDEVLAEWAVQVHGLRFVGRFGSLHAIAPPDVEEREPSYACSIVCPAEPLIDAARAGDAQAADLLALIRGRRSTRVPVPSDQPTPDAPPDDRELISRVRTWWHHHKALQRGDDPPVSDPGGLAGADHRPVGLWEEQHNIDHR